MRESCKSSGASKARGSGVREAPVRGNSDWGRRHGGDDGGDKWGPRGGDRGKGVAAGLRKLEEEAASGNYPKTTQAGMGRARVCGPREERGHRGDWTGGEAGRADWLLGRSGPKVKKKSFLNKKLIFDYSKALEICRRKFRRNFDMRIFPKFF
jgi:hypothetical protein